MKVLLISYYFTPSTAIGAKRWSYFYNSSRHDKEIEFTVLTANWNGHKETDDNIKYLGEQRSYNPTKSLNKNISYIDVLQHPTLCIRSFSSSIFDKWVSDVNQWILENNTLKFDLILSSYGPLSTIIVGNYAKKVFKVPYIVDLRDLISIQGQKKQVFILDFLDKYLDKFFTAKVDAFITVNETCSQKAKLFYVNKNIATIYNCFENKFTSDIDLSINVTSKIINILYMGTIGINRNPYTILKILNEFAIANSDMILNIRFASQDDPNLFVSSDIISHINIEWLGYLAKDKLTDYIKASDIFLILEDLDVKGNENMTGKIYEYVNFRKPIIASCNKDSEIVKFLEYTNFGCLIDTTDKFRNFLLSKRIVNCDRINFFTVENQYKELIKMFNIINENKQ